MARINLTVAPPVAQVLAEVATATGMSQSAAVASFLAWKLPELHQWLRHLHRERPTSPAAAPPAPARPAVPALELSRKERRAEAREAKKDRQRREKTAARRR